jgi:hypothetical protein
MDYRVDRDWEMYLQYQIRGQVRSDFPQSGKKSRTGPLYHLSHGQREPDGF